MEFSSVQKLCQHLLSSAFQRCRVSEDLCRLSVVLKCSPSPDPPSLVRVSISDTGVGSCLEEFQALKYAREVGGADKWDGVLSVRTTGICDTEVIHYQLNLRESNSTRRLTRLPSNSKNGVKFSGTEVYLSIFESIDVLVAEVKCFFQKMLILKIPNVAVELVAECGDVSGSQHSNVFLANEFNPLPFSASNIERLKSGLEDYVLKHGNTLERKCESCFPSWENLKVGRGMVCCTENRRTSVLVTEAVIVISEFSDSPCFRASGAKMELLYFKEFSLCSISQSSANALTTMDWKSYGLTLGSIVDQGGCALLEWEDLPPCARINIALHCYNDQAVIAPAKQNTQSDRSLIKKAVKLALDDLKEKYAGVLLSARALKIRSYAPDLARTIAGLILSSKDSDFQGECFSLLGLQSQEIKGQIVEDCIKEKIISVIEMNDRKPRRSKEAAPFLFEDDSFPDLDFLGEEYEEDEDAFSVLD